MSFMDIFKPAPAPAAAPASAATTLSSSPATTNADNKMPGTDQTPKNPLDTYKEMFDNASKNSDIQAPTFKLDPKVLNDVSSKMDFTQGVDKDLMTKALSGDANALLQVIQTTSQNAYKASLEHNSALTDTFINQRSTFEQNNINKGVKNQLTQQNLASAPNYDHPVIKQELNRVADQFAKANPDMPPQEIAKAAQKYIADLSAALAPAAPKTEAQKAEEMDWSKYLNS